MADGRLPLPPSLRPQDPLHMRPYWTPFHQSRSVSREEGDSKCNRVLAEKRPGLSSSGFYIVPERRGCRSHGGDGQVLRRAGQGLGPSPSTNTPQAKKGVHPHGARDSAPSPACTHLVLSDVHGGKGVPPAPVACLRQRVLRREGQAAAPGPCAGHEPPVWLGSWAQHARGTPAGGGWSPFGRGAPICHGCGGPLWAWASPGFLLGP